MSLKIQTPSELVAADPVSQSKRCSFCSKVLEGPAAPHLCAVCGKPQPLIQGDSGDFFTAFGVSRKFSQDRKALEKRFYELSRFLHPDRFTNLSSSSPAQDSRRLSLERMSFVNQAYTTLKNPESLREYFLAIEEVHLDGLTSEKAQIPMELAESWFDLQDAISESSEDLLPKIDSFERELLEKSEDIGAEILALETKFDESAARVHLLQIAKAIQSQSYLRSLHRDVLKIKGGLT